jgi:hypothetical protein
LKKRQRKKLDKKLFKAIKELNEDAAKDLGFGKVEEESLIQPFNRIRKDPVKIRKVFKDYEFFILKK